VTAALLSAALATLAHPRWWPIALAGFLVRGGVLVVIAPIVVAPTVAGVMSQFAPTIVGQVIVGGPNTPVALLTGILTGAVVLLAWIAGTLGAAFDAALVEEAATDEELGLDLEVPVSLPPGLGTARLGTHLLTAVVFAIGAVRIFEVAYVEATSPGSPTTPFVERVLSQVPVQLVAIGVALLVAEALGGLALRALLLDPAMPAAGLARAVARAVRTLIRPRSLAIMVVTTLIVLAVGLPGGLAAGRAWSQVRLVFLGPATPEAMAIALFLFVAVVFGWLTLLGVALAWRSAVWTAVSARTVTHTLPSASEATR